MDKRIAVVTGANRGIGLEICRQLTKTGMYVILTARDAAKATAAADQIAVESRQLDVDNDESVRTFGRWITETHGRCDVLVNNAGVMLDPRGSRVLDAKIETFRATLETNLLGPLRMMQAIIPMMKKQGYGRIVNMSSGQGQLSEMGVGTPAYRVSKTALNALTRTTAADLHASGILVNAMCPGWVRTDMGGSGAPRSVEQGADTAVWLATLPDNGPSGSYFRDRKPLPW